MKFLIALMFIAVASAGRITRRNRDVSEYYGAGWSKGADGYSYDIPTNNLENTVSTTYYEEPVYEAPAVSAPVVTEQVYSAPAEESYSPSYTATTTYTDTGFSTSYGPEAGVAYTDASSGSGSYAATDYYPQDYTQEQTLREYLPPALRRRRLRLQKRKLRFVKRH